MRQIAVRLDITLQRSTEEGGCATVAFSVQRLAFGGRRFQAKREAGALASALDDRSAVDLC
jgi:hypothetical protein